MAETIDEILNGSDEGTEVVDQAANVDEGADGTTGEDDAQVAAENDAAAEEVQQQPTMKGELAALAKERERIRQKEVALDAELQKLKGQQQSGEGKQQADEAGSQQPTLKELNKQYREALSAVLVDPSDEEAAKLVEDLEEQIEAARIAVATQSLKTVSVQEKAQTEFNEVFDSVHAAYPFLDPDHPQADAVLNADINAFYEGLLRRGESKADALRKAVDTFAPAQAKKLGLVPAAKAGKPSQSTGSSTAREKLKGGFSEVRNAGNGSRVATSYSGPTPMDDILGKKST